MLTGHAAPRNYVYDDTQRVYTWCHARKHKMTFREYPGFSLPANCGTISLNTFVFSLHKLWSNWDLINALLFQYMTIKYVKYARGAACACTLTTPEHGANDALAPEGWY